MKKLYYLLVILFPVLVLGQSQDQNYVKTTVYKKASTTTSIDENNPADASVQVLYYDGLGRPIQQVGYKQSASGKDLIQHVEYDVTGRQTKEYLPYVRSSASKDYDASAAVNVGNFYSSNNPSLTGNPHFDTTGNPFSQIETEDSPLGRVFKQAAPGNAWLLGQGKEIKFDYLTNGEEEVRFFRASAVWNSEAGLYTISLIVDGYYDANQLQKNIVKDENHSSGVNNTVEEFTDKEGRVVLKRAYENNEKHDTYYVYDQFGNLTYVLPPAVNTAQTITQTILDDLCYQYKYDHKNRLVEKKQPGKKVSEFMVYDKANRLVMTGPVKPPFYHLSKDGWLFIKYDAYNRVVMTGFMAMQGSAIVDNAARKARQEERDSQTANFNESRLPQGTTNNSNVGAFVHSYTSNSIPESGYHILTVNYYDNYTYADAPTVPSSIADQPVTTMPKGQLTGKWTRVLNLTTTTHPTRKEVSHLFYDEKGRAVSTFVRNHENSLAYTQTDVTYDFEGKVMETNTLHKRTNGESGVTIKNTYGYSDQGRLLTNSHKVGANTEQLLAQNTYDEIGRLIQKKTGNTANNPLQKTDYRYNVRGWLTHINDVDNLEQAGDPKDLFAFKINYNTVTNTVNQAVKPLYNGNIAEIFWKTASDDALRSYSYVYDKLNRLKDAYYHKNNSVEQFFDEHVTEYDKNGNILSLTRNGGSDLTELEIDELEYVYEGNQLKNVMDHSISPEGFKDSNTTGDDFEYDDYGNIKKDKNKGITTDIRYNHLNLPTEIVFANGDKIQYVYNAEGKKLEKTVVENNVSTTTKYLEGFQYVNNVLNFFPHAEGYVAKQGSSTFKYVFQYRDHLGNVRLSYAKNPTTGNLDIIEENNYYPFGLRHIGYNNDLWLTHGNGEAQKYKYNDREYQSELGLNVTAMDFRQYDAALGRFNAIDALAGSMPSSTPYHFGFNNPIYWADPTGLMPEWLQSMWDATPNGTNSYWLNDGAGNFDYAGDGFGGGNPDLYGSFVNNKGQFFGGGGGSGSYIIYNGNPDAGLLHTVVVQAYQSKGVGQPKGWETAIPVWGSGRAAVDHFQNGNYWRGIGYSALAISDVFLVKAAVTAIGKGIAVGGAKLASNRVFWSGGEIAKNSAAEFAVANGMKTLEMTTMGSIMNTISPHLPRSITAPIWDILSANFARGATGTINVFQNAAGVGINSTWARIEYEILKDSNIIYHVVK